MSEVERKRKSSVSPLEQMTVVIGANGAGKTALLQRILKEKAGECTYLSGRLPMESEFERWVGWLDRSHELRKLGTLMGFVFPEVFGVRYRPEGSSGKMFWFLTSAGKELSASEAPGGWIRCAVILAGFLLVDPPGPFMADNADTGLDPGAWSRLFSVLNREGAEMGIKTVLAVHSPIAIDQARHEDILCAVREGEETSYRRLVDNPHYHCYCGGSRAAFTAGEMYYNERLWEPRRWDNENPGEYLKIEVPSCYVQLRISTGGEGEATVADYSVGHAEERLPVVARVLGYALKKLDGKGAEECVGEFDRAVQCLEDETNRKEFLAMLPGDGNLWPVTSLMKWLRDSCRRHPKCTVRVRKA